METRQDGVQDSFEDLTSRFDNDQLITSSLNMDDVAQIKIRHIANDLSVDNLDATDWRAAESINVERYWSGDAAPIERQFRAQLLWSDAALYARFEAAQHEPLVVNDKPDLAKKTLKLWERDVCEIFVAPDKEHRNKYFEFEVAPTGEWIDLGIELTPSGRKTDWDYASGMTSAARTHREKVVMAIRIPFAAFDRSPKSGDIWLGNLFRCVGAGATRGYLAWQPTKTPEPAFHVPSAFGELKFTK